MANQRVVRKSKAGVQDLVLGKGTVTQQRGENQYEIERLDHHVAVDTIAEMTALDTDDFTRARVYSDATTFVDYIFDPDATEGEAPDDNTVNGFWVLSSAILGTSKVTPTGKANARTLAEWVDKEAITYDVVSEALADELLELGMRVLVFGETTAGDTGGGTYTVVPADSGVAPQYLDMANGLQLKAKDVIPEPVEPILMGSDSPRSVIQYNGPTSVNVRDTNFVMGGFRFQGKYKKAYALNFEASSHESRIDTDTDLPFGMTGVMLQNWYGVFACANTEDSEVTFRAVPFLRVKQQTGSAWELGAAGEAITAAQVADPSLLDTRTYSWLPDALNNSDILVITETVDSRANAFSGRVTKVVDSTASTLTLADDGTVNSLDWLLPAPSEEFEHYRYCGAFYVDTAEVRNIADTGTLVKTRGTTDNTGTNAGAISPPEKRHPSGTISPLATAVYLQSTGVLSTGVLGQYVEAFWIDSAHDVSKFDLDKSNAGSQSFNSGEIVIPFSFGPQYFYSNAGALASSRINGSQNLWGWIEA